tara:strand:- start:1059 stop:1376 length:318 start_codon:yes stop_codon:yes gene_type:complete
MATGLYKYTAKEASNLLLGQNGFDLIAEHDTNTVNPDTGSWIAIQALGKGGGDAAVEFLKLKVTTNIGDDITSFFYMIPGEILYGNFNGIINHTDSTATCIAYRG